MSAVAPPILLVPQGSEYHSVCRGLRRVHHSLSRVFPIPVGADPLFAHLEKLKKTQPLFTVAQPQILLMGLCGSVSDYGVADVVICQSCERETSAQPYFCDAALTLQLQQKLQNRVSLVSALTSDRVIHSAVEKRQIAQAFDVDVVDMEGVIVLESLSSIEATVAMIRVVSDDSNHDIPDLTGVNREDGSLNNIDLATRLIKQPIAAVRLIRGALRGLQALESVTAEIFKSC